MKHIYTRCVKCWKKIRVTFNREVSKVILEVICCDKKNSKNKKLASKKEMIKQ